jgi:hypothetical protein
MAKGTFVQLQKVAAHAINPLAQAPSRIPRAFRVAESRKRRKFAPLLAAAQQHLSGEAQVQFLTFGFSTQGTLSPGAEETIKCLKEAYGKKCEGEPAPRDGAPMKYRMAKFEADTRDEIAVAIARGVGESHAIAGRPDLQGWRCSRADEWRAYAYRFTMLLNDYDDDDRCL